MVNIAEKEKENKARLVVAWREAYRTDSHDTSTENNKVNGTINKKRAKIQSGYCMRVLGMKREEQKQCKRGWQEKKRVAPSWRQHLKEETDVTDTPKSSSCRSDLDGMMTILECPENRRKAQAQQVMEPSVAHQCQKQTKKTLVTKENTLCLCCTNKEIALSHIVNQGVLQ
jgi:hypothetical protein